MKHSIPDIGFIKESKKIYQVFCGDELDVNEWLKSNPDIEVANILANANEFGEIITVVYKIEAEVKNNEQ